MTNPTEPDGKPAAKPTVGTRKPRQPTAAQRAAATRQRSDATREAALVALGQWSAVEFGVTWFQQLYCAALFVADCINPGGDILDFLLPTEEMQLRKHNKKVLALEITRFSSEDNAKIIKVLTEVAEDNDVHQVLVPSLVKKAHKKIMEQTRLALKAYSYLSFYYRAGPLSRQEIADQVRLRFERDDVQNLSHLESRIEAFGAEQMQEFADQGGLDDDGMQDKVHETRAFKKKAQAAQGSAAAAASLPRQASFELASPSGREPANLPEYSVVTRTTRVTFFGRTQGSDEQRLGDSNELVGEEELEGSNPPDRNETLLEDPGRYHDSAEETESSDESEDPNEINDRDDAPFEIPLHAATARHAQVQYELQLARRKRKNLAPPKPPRGAPSTNKKQRRCKGCNSNDYTNTNRNESAGGTDSM